MNEHNPLFCFGCDAALSGPLERDRGLWVVRCDCGTTNVVQPSLHIIGTAAA